MGANKTYNIGIVVPCFNAEKFIAYTIESVQRQQYGNWIMVVVDDGSIDKSYDIAKEYARSDDRIHLVRQVNSGVCVARNRGYYELKKLSNDIKYVLFLDADDLLHRCMLKKLSLYLDKHFEAGAVFCGFVRINEKGECISVPKMSIVDILVHKRIWFAKLSGTYCGLIPFYSTMFSAVNIPSNTLIRCSVFEQIGGWDESLPQLAEDVDLFMKIALFSELHVWPEPLVYYRKHSNQATTKNADLISKHITLLQKRWIQYWQQQPPSPERTKVLRTWHLKMGRVGAWMSMQAGWRHIRQGRYLTGLRDVIAGVRRYLTSFLPYEWGWMY